MNNLPYVLAVEKLAGIEGARPGQGHPDHDGGAVSHHQPISSGTALLPRMSACCRRYFSCSTTANGPLRSSPAFTGRPDAPEAGFRIGGVAQDLPRGWNRLIEDFLKYMPPRLKEYDAMVMGNYIFKKRTPGALEATTLDEAIDWGVTGPGSARLRPRVGFSQKTPPIPAMTSLNSTSRPPNTGIAMTGALVRIEEIRQSLRIIDQCLNHMPEGPYKADHPLTTPPPQGADPARHRNPYHPFFRRQLGSGHPGR